MKRTGSAIWQGDLKNGRGTVSTESGVLSKTPYSFTTRFEHGTGTNPEELVAAAHAGCFSMALSAQLGEAGLFPEKLETMATITLRENGSRVDRDERIVERQGQSAERRRGGLGKGHSRG